jgi:hypothetical protein
MSEGTAVTKRTNLAPEVDARIAENKARNAVARAIRGTQWGKDLGPDGAYALAEYCRANGLDPVRHVEVLGGRPYLTAEYYRERAAAFIRAGVVIPQPIDFINADPRLQTLADAGDEWAKGETTRRLRERIRLNAPEKAAAIAVKRIVVAKTGELIEGANWCGGGVRQRDPVGDAEPTKTAETRAERRAWRQLADVVNEYAQVVRTAETGAEQVEDAIVTELDAVVANRPKLSSGYPVGNVVTTDAYGHGDAMPDADASLARVRREVAQGLPDPYGVGEAA